GDLPQNEPALSKECVRILGCPASGFGEMDQHKICRARGHSESKRPDLFGQPSEPPRVMRAGALYVCGVADRCDTGSDCGTTHVEWPTNTIYRANHVRRSVHPAKAQRRKPVDLGKGERHHDVVSRGNQFNSVLVI